MSNKEFFPQRPSAKPIIYAYELTGVATHQGWLKIGFTDRDAKTRVKEQLRTAEESAMKSKGYSPIRWRNNE